MHGVGVCDSPDYFCDHIREVALDLKLDLGQLGDVKSWLTIYPGQGVGYARSTAEELAFLLSVSSFSGVILDPVYSGKALYHFMEKVVKGKGEWQEGEGKGRGFQEGEKVLFIHTGGVFGLYDKADELLPLLPKDGVQKLTIIPPKIGKA